VFHYYLTLISAPPQTTTIKPYTNCIRATISAAMCIENFASQIIERHNKPEVEAKCVISISCILSNSHLIFNHTWFHGSNGN